MSWPLACTLNLRRLRASRFPPLNSVGPSLFRGSKLPTERSKFPRSCRRTERCLTASLLDEFQMATRSFHCVSATG